MYAASPLIRPMYGTFANRPLTRQRRFSHTLLNKFGIPGVVDLVIDERGKVAGDGLVRFESMATCSVNQRILICSSRSSRQLTDKSVA